MIRNDWARLPLAEESPESAVVLRCKSCTVFTPPVTLEACCGVGDLRTIGDCQLIYMDGTYGSSQQIVTEMKKKCHGLSGDPGIATSS